MLVTVPVVPLLVKCSWASSLPAAGGAEQADGQEGDVRRPSRASVCGAGACRNRGDRVPFPHADEIRSIASALKSTVAPSTAKKGRSRKVWQGGRTGHASARWPT